MAAGQGIALKQALALVLGKLLDNVTNWGDVLVVLEVVVEAAEPLLVGYLEGWLQTVGSGLVRSEDTELGAVAVDELSGVLAKDARCLSSTKAVALLGNWDLVLLCVRKDEIAADCAAVCVRVSAEAEVALRHESGNLWTDCALLGEEGLWPVGAHPVAKDLEVSLGVASGCQWNLVCAPRALGLLAVDVRRASPTLRGAEDDHWVVRTGCVTCGCASLNSADLVEDSLKKSCETTVDGCVVLVVEASNKVVLVVAHAAEELVALTVGNTSKDGWVSNLVAIEVQDWEDDTIGQWVHELVGLPRSCKWAGLCLAVADNSDCQQGWVVQDSAVCVGQGVAQLAALVDGAWSLRCVVGRNSAWIRETAEELLEALFIVGDEWVGLAISAVEQGLCGTCRSTMTRAHKEDGVLVMVADETVDVAEQEVQTWGGSPVTNQAMLNVLARETVLHKRVTAKINLTNRQVVSCAPIPIDAGKLVLRYRLIQGLPRCAVHGLSHVLLLFLGCYLRVYAG